MEERMSEPVKATKRYAGMSHDGRTNVWRVVCGKCGKDKSELVDTLRRYYAFTCQYCKADNEIDFNER
jgi:hypothetical protein